MTGEFLEKGDLIGRRLSGNIDVFYSHVGVYVDDENIIHFTETDTNKEDVKITKTSLKEFAQGRDVEIWARAKNNEHSEAICEQADFILKDRGRKDSDNCNFILNNCEDFATSCYEVAYNGINHTLPIPSQRITTMIFLTQIGVRLISRI